MRKILTLALAAGLFTALPPTHSQSSRTGRDPAGLERGAGMLLQGRDPVLSPRQDGCVEHTISCGQTVTSRITDNDCAYQPPDENIRFDFWSFQAMAGQTVTLTLSSDDFNPFLILYDPDLGQVAEDDDSGPGDAARVIFPIDRTSPNWNLDATPLEENVFGDYTLSLECSGQPPPPPPPPGPECPAGFFGDPEYPDFCFAVTITPPGGAPIDGTREPQCIEDTVCVSGALAGRSEVYVRILGPRPNGFLWPTITRFTPSRVEVDVYQISSDTTRSYTLDAVPPGDDDLSGLQDRMGFQP